MIRHLRNITAGVLTFMMTMSVFVLSPANAAVVQNFGVTGTRTQVSTAANYVVRYVTHTGVESSTDTMTLTFESGFDLSSLSSPLDFDLAIDDDSACDGAFTDKTLAASAAAGTWGVGISGQTITFTAPTDAAGGEIAADRCVQIQIGTNAQAGGAGSNQITNPGSAGAYEVALEGTFGDTGQVSVDIETGDTITVNGTSGTTGGGGGQGGGPTDTTAPVIMNLQVINITETTATVTWDTDELADSEVKWGLTTNYELGTTYTPNDVFAHSIDLSGLTAATQYFVQVQSVDTSGNAASQTTQFTTTDTSAPIISNVQVVNLTTNSATVTWDTNEAANSAVDYGETAGYEIGTEADGAFVTSHSIPLSGLTPGTQYHYRIRSSDASANEASTLDATFTTVADPPPANVINLVVTPGLEQNVLTWDNPAEPDYATTRVIFKTDDFPSGPSDGTILIDSSVDTYTHTGLTGGQEYFYGVFVVDTGGQFSSGALGSGIPTSPNPPPGNVINFNASGGVEQNSLTWQNPADPDLDGVRITFRLDQFPISPSDGTQIFEGQGTNYTHTGLSGGQEYFYGAFAFDTAAQFATGAFDSAIPSSPAPPPPPPEPDEPPPTEPGAEGGAPFCGDGICGAIETFENCPQDCEAPAVEPGNLLRDLVQFFAQNGTVELDPDRDGSFETLPRTELDIVVTPDDTVKPIARMNIQFNPTVELIESNGVWSARFTSPDTPGAVTINLNVTYEDGEEQTLNFTMFVQNPGEVFEIVEGVESLSAGATVTLLDCSAGACVVWNAAEFGQQNPLVVGGDGAFAWVVPPGEYQVRVTKDNFQTEETSPFTELGGVINPTLRIIKIAIIPEPILPVVPEPALQVVADTAEVVTRSVEAVADVAIQVNEAVEVVRELPGVEETAAVATPAVAVATAGTVGVLAFNFNLIPLTQYVFTSPVLLFWRRRRRAYGTVYNAISKIPIDLAIVRLYRAADNKLVRSRVTDKQGRYAFLVQEGEYRLVVTKPQFTFPSEYLKEQKEDGDFLDIYHGETVRVTGKDAVISANIPVDPLAGDAEKTPAKIKIKERLRTVQNVIAIAGIVFAAYIVVINPTALTAVIAVGQVVAYVLVRRLATPPKPKNWGFVKDKVSGGKLKDVVVRVFEPKYNKLLDTRVTDASGRYFFLLGPNEYYATFEKPGYKTTEVRPIDYTANKEPVEFAEKVDLEKGEQPPTS